MSECECPPCPGRGHDGHGMNHCAECCFGSGVVAEIDCPLHDIRPGHAGVEALTERPMVAPELRHDELDADIAQSMRDPEYRAAYEDATTRHAVLDALLAQRRRVGLTQSEVGQRMGNVKQPTISEFESEPSDPRLSTVQRYARAVGLRLVVTLVSVEEPGWEPT